jgi:alpha-glucosidase
MSLACERESTPLFSDITGWRALPRHDQVRYWRGHDPRNNSYILSETQLGPAITRLLLCRGKRPERQRYQLASGAQGTLPYHSCSVEKGDESWPVTPGRPSWRQCRRAAFAASQSELRVLLPLGQHVHLYGFGERTDGLDKRALAFPIWNIDPPTPYHAETVTMYTSIPFFLCLDSARGETQGVLIDQSGMLYADLGQSQPDQIVLTGEGDLLVVYFFAGPTPADVLQQYSELSGYMPLPPRWALGYHQSRWSYASAEEVRAIATTMRARQHPCDALWLDIDYMDGFRNFTWNATTFPQPRELIAELRSQGLRLVTIIDPGTRVDPTYDVYQQALARDFFCRLPGGELFVGHVWPGACAFPDFSRQQVRRWWGALHHTHVALGVAGIWNDMNEPALTSLCAPDSSTQTYGRTMDDSVLHQAGGEDPRGPDGPPLSHRQFHNAYGMQMARATYQGLRHLQPDGRPFVLTRSGTAGIQRYAAVWTGDNTSAWEYIPQAISTCLNLSMSGVPFIGVDIGGFWQDASGELLVRFTQLGALLPFCRNHSARGTAPQEPWAFAEPYETALRTAIALRYRALPYLYTLFAAAAHTGAPLMRPLAYHFPRDEQACRVSDAFFLGDTLLCAPVYEAGADSRQVYLPAGEWFHYWTDQLFQGPATHQIAAPLDHWPLFVRANRLLPLGPLMQYTDERPTDPLTIHCYMSPQGEASYTLYEDDGATQAYANGAYARTLITCQAGPHGLQVTIEEQGARYRPQRTSYDLVAHLPGRTLTARLPAGQGKSSLHLS